MNPQEQETTTTRRVLVCGGRDFTAEWEVFQALQKQWAQHGERLVVIDGGARGADAAAAMWAESWHRAGNDVEHVQFKAKWTQHGKGAGPIRNQQMLDEGKPDVVLAFPGGNGTADMVRRAEKAGIPVEYPEYDPMWPED